METLNLLHLLSQEQPLPILITPNRYIESTLGLLMPSNSHSTKPTLSIDCEVLYEEFKKHYQFLVYYNRYHIYRKFSVDEKFVTLLYLLKLKHKNNILLKNYKSLHLNFVLKYSNNNIIFPKLNDLFGF